MFIAGSIPILQGLSRWYLVECGLTAIVSVAVCLIAEWNDGGDIRRAFFLGVTCGLGLLMKFSYPLYVVIPMFFLLLKDGRARLRPRTLLAFLTPACALALPWYLFNFRQAVGVALRAGSPETARIYNTGDIFSPVEIWRYWVNISNVSPTLYLAALPLLFLVFARFVRPSGKRGLLLCALWGTPLIFLTFSHYRDLRYAAPIFPALALALAILLNAAIERHGIAAAVVTCVLLALPALSLLQTSFGVLGDRKFDLGGILFVSARFSYLRIYDRHPWPLQEILADIYRDAKFTGGERKRLIAGTDSVRFNADNLALAAIESHLPIDVSTTAYETDLSALLPKLDSASYFVYKAGGEPVSPFNRLGGDAIKLVREDRRFVELLPSRKLPDGGIAHVFQNVSSSQFGRNGAFLSAGMDDVPDCRVIFDGKIELAGLSIERTAEGLAVKYRWRCLKPVDRDYWCFTHVVDEQGRIAGYLDHPILGGEPPTSAWRQGDIAIERLSLALPDSRKPGPYHLKLGLFHRASGERLAVTAADFPLTDGNTAAVVMEKRARP